METLLTPIELICMFDLLTQIMTNDAKSSNIFQIIDSNFLHYYYFFIQRSSIINDSRIMDRIIFEYTIAFYHAVKYWLKISEKCTFGQREINHLD